MFNIGWTELLVIAVVALLVIGPKELPGALRTLGQWMAKIRGMASEFQNQFHEAMREAELAELKKDVDEMAAKAQSYAHFDPIEDIRKDIESAAAPPPALDAPVTETPPATEAAAAAPTTPSGDMVASDMPPPAGEASAEPVQVAEVAPAPKGPLDAVPGAPSPDAGRAA